MIITQLPFEKDGDKIKLTGPVFLSCGCGNVTARWATVQQNLITKIPQGKPKSSRMINDWLTQEGLKEKWPVLKQHTYGIVVVETTAGLEMVNVMTGTTNKTAEQIADLIKRRK